MDAKWSEHFSHLEAILLERSFQPPTGQSSFQNNTMPVSPKKVGTLTSDRPLIQPRVVSLTFSQPVTGSGEMISTSQAHASVHQEDLPSISTAGAASLFTHNDFGKQSDLASPVHLKIEGEVSDQETGTAKQESDEVTLEEQNYRETVRGVRSYLGFEPGA